MGVVLPWMLAVGAIAVAAITVLHLLSVRQPQELLLPTARFLSDREIRAVSRTRRPTDVLLLALRIGVLLLLAFAAAGVWWRSTRVTRLVLIVADADVVADSAAALAVVRAGPADSGAAVVKYVSVADEMARFGSTRHASTDAAQSSDQRSASAAVFPAAWRAAARAVADDPWIDEVALHVLLGRADATELARTDGGAVDVSGWRSWRDVWPGRVVVRTTEAAQRVALDTLRRVVVMNGDTVHGERSADDPVRTALAMYAARWSRAGATRVDTVRVFRGAARRDDSRRRVSPDVATKSASVVSVYWPISGVPFGWREVRADSSSAVFALASGGRAMMASWHVPAEFAPVNNTMSSDLAPIAWWSDGRVAAVEHRLSCARDVAVQLQTESDVLLSEAAMPLMARVLAPCGDRTRVSPASLTARSVDTTGGAQALAPASAFRLEGLNGRTLRMPWFAPLLLTLALVLLAYESWLRARSTADAT